MDRRVHLVVIVVRRGIVAPTVLVVANSRLPATPIDVTPPVEILRSLTVTRIERDVLITVCRTRLRVEPSEFPAAVNADELGLAQISTATITLKIGILIVYFVGGVVAMDLAAPITFERGREWPGPDSLGFAEVVVGRVRRVEALSPAVPVVRPGKHAIEDVLGVDSTADVTGLQPVHLPDAALVAVVERVPRKELEQDLLTATFH